MVSEPGSRSVAVSYLRSVSGVGMGSGSGWEWQIYYYLESLLAVQRHSFPIFPACFL